MITPKFRGQIDRTRSKVWPVIYDADLVKFHDWFDKFPEGTHVFVTIKKIEKRQMRSIVQNNYYWGVVIDILSDFTGYDPEEMHNALRHKFLTYENIKGLPTTLSTTQLKTNEFEDYLERIRRWAATDLGVYIPLPNEVETK
jgi:hypothetical protein